MKTTQIICSLLVAWLLWGSAEAQECNIPLRVILPQQVEMLPQASQGYFKNKLRQIAVQNGIIGNSECTPFAITALIDVMDEHILSGTPTKMVYLMNVSLYIIDTHEEKIFSVSTVEVKAVGNNKTKVYMDGIKQIPPSNKEIQEFVKKGKEKILAYYDKNYLKIIRKAQTLATMGKYEEALYHVTSIPECCMGYDKAVTASLSIYQQYVNRDGLENISKARMAWAVSQDVEGAVEAGKYLRQISPDADCYSDAMQLYEEMKNKVREAENLEMRKYSDEVALEKQRIEAIKAIGVAYGGGQQPETTNLMWLK